ncbi:Odorant receptor 2a [Acromyrmex echinatior]|uniref:Odorant receptor 2a n=1 Tax=Acromyrmex echinatior TaxID=103372 RepID=F4X3U4_ACREC|nr:Odorant receptor 2a [Acromyrmex echinatior]
MIPTSTVDNLMEFTLRMIGIWPHSSYKFLMRIVWTTTMTIWQFLQYWHLFTHIGSDTLPNLMDSLSLCLSNSLLFLKMNFLWLNGRIIYDMLARIAEDWNECSSNNSKMQLMISKAILSHRISKYSIGTYTVVLLLFGAGNMIVQKTMGSEQLVEEKQLIVKMKLPSEFDASPIYEIVVVTQFFVQFTLALLAGMLNALIVTLILHVAGQIDIICHELLEIPVAENKYDSRIILLRSIVSRHQRIIAFADSIEDVFCYMALMQFLLNTFVICFLGFVIVTYYYLLTHFSTKELPNLIDGLSTTLPHSLLFFKLIVLWANHRIFKNILIAMSNDWHKYSNMYAMIDKAVLAHRCSKLIITVYSIAVLLYSTASINLNKQSDDDCRELLIKMELPFGFCESPIYEIVMFVQFVRLIAVASAIGMLNALLVTLSLGTDEGVRMLVKTLFFYIAITLEAFIFCFAGEYLSNKSKTIGDAVYGSVWYNLKPQDSRILLFMIMRSQRRLTITAGKFMDLSLEGFANVRFQ